MEDLHERNGMVERNCGGRLEEGKKGRMKTTDESTSGETEERDGMLEFLESRARDIMASIEQLEKEGMVDWVEGFQKFKRRVRKELNFIQRLKSRRGRRLPEPAHARGGDGDGEAALEDDNEALLGAQHASSNVPHMFGVRECLRHLPGIVAITTAKEYATGDPEEGHEPALVPVDAVACNGNLWVKVRASRGVRSWIPYRDCETAGPPDDQAVVDLAENLVLAAKQNPNSGRVPKVALAFLHGTVATITVERLTKMGVRTVWFGSGVAPASGPREKTSRAEDERKGSNSVIPTLEAFAGTLRKEDSKRYLSLDVTAIVALCSDICQDRKEGELKKFSESLKHMPRPIVAMVEHERVCPALPVIRDAMRARVVVVCETAKACAERIFKTVGGEDEKGRFKSLMETIRVSLLIRQMDKASVRFRCR